MSNDGIPTRKEDNYLSEMIMMGANPKFDLFLFVEDETTPWVYEQIMDRLFHRKVCVGKVFALKAKNSVIKTYKEWESGEILKEKCMFIIDKDFDYWLEDNINGRENVLELPCYTLENLLFDEFSVSHLIKIHNRDNEMDKILESEFIQTWISKIYQDLKPLFLDFALVKMNKINKVSTSQNPDRYIKETGEVRETEIEKYNKEVIEIFEKEGRDYQRAIEQMAENFTVAESFDYKSLIKGKYLLHALIKKVNHLTSSRIKTPPDNTLMSLLIYSVSIDNFLCIEEKYKMINSTFALKKSI